MIQEATQKPSIVGKLFWPCFQMVEKVAQAETQNTLKMYNRGSIIVKKFSPCAYRWNFLCKVTWFPGLEGSGMGVLLMISWLQGRVEQ